MVLIKDSGQAMILMGMEGSLSKSSRESWLELVSRIIILHAILMNYYSSDLSVIYLAFSTGL